MKLKIFLIYIGSFLYLFANSNNMYNISDSYKSNLQKLNNSIILEGKNALINKNYIDFGIAGKLYDIKEKNFLVEYENEKHKLIKYLSRDYIKKQLMKTIKKISNFQTNKPLCIRDQKIGPLVDYVKVPTNIVNPLGRIIFKKGEKIPSKIPNGKTLDLCFINGNGNKITTINEINFFKKQNPNCVFLVSDYNVMKLRDMFPSLEIYPSSQKQEERFELKCYPVHIHFYNDKKIYYYYNYNRFKN